jgi:hypothetical protein
MANSQFLGISRIPPACYGVMRDLAVLFLHPLATTARSQGRPRGDGGLQGQVFVIVRQERRRGVQVRVDAYRKN